MNHHDIAKPNRFLFSRGERAEILDFARYSLQRALANLPLPMPPEMTVLKQKSGCFVTLLELASGGIRGCMGSVLGMEMLGTALQRHVLNAAFQTPGCPPVEMAELNEVKIKVEVVKNLQKADFSVWQCGRHGAVLEYKNFRSAFLPQVAQSQQWRMAEMLNALAAKLGLPQTAWQLPEAKVEWFETEIFIEE